MSTTPISETAAEARARFDIPAELHMLDQANRVVGVRIRRVSPSLFELSSLERLREGQRLVLSHEGRRIEVAVSSAAQGASGVYLLAVNVDSQEAGEVRSEFRLPTDLPAVIRVAGEAEQVVVKIVDMSPSGMGIEVPVALPRGAKVCVNLAQGLAFGEIRFCREKAGGVFFVGFFLEEYIGQE